MLYDLLFVKKWCKKNRIKFYYKIFNLIDYKLKNKKGIQESARDLRYKWFNHLTTNKGFDYLVTAHHLNDQFEIIHFIHRVLAFLLHEYNLLTSLLIGLNLFLHELIKAS